MYWLARIYALPNGCSALCCGHCNFTLKTLFPDWVSLDEFRGAGNQPSIEGRSTWKIPISLEAWRVSQAHQKEVSFGVHARVTLKRDQMLHGVSQHTPALHFGVHGEAWAIHSTVLVLQTFDSTERKGQRTMASARELHHNTAFGRILLHDVALRSRSTSRNQRPR